jgi:error-prone DNA polymerase
VLGKTLGVPLFQEQAMKVAIACAGFHGVRGRSAPPLHGDLQVHGRGQRLQGQARRRHGPQRLRGGIRRAHLQAARGFWVLRLSRKPRGLLRQDRLRLVLGKCHHPDIFCAALLNAQPMGFYAPGADRAGCEGATGSRCGPST